MIETSSVLLMNVMHSYLILTDETFLIKLNINK